MWQRPLVAATQESCTQGQGKGKVMRSARARSPQSRRSHLTMGRGSGLLPMPAVQATLLCSLPQVWRVATARALGLAIFHSLDDVPGIEDMTSGRDANRFWVGRISIALALLAAAYWCEYRYDLSTGQVIFGLAALVSAIAATGWPPFLFGSIRNGRWFRLIRSDTTMRRVLAAIAVVLLGLAYLIDR